MHYVIFTHEWRPPDIKLISLLIQIQLSGCKVSEAEEAVAVAASPQCSGRTGSCRTGSCRGKPDDVMTVNKMQQGVLVGAEFGGRAWLTCPKQI